MTARDGANSSRLQVDAFNRGNPDVMATSYGERAVNDQVVVLENRPEEA
jgi:hypothetical protein